MADEEGTSFESAFTALFAKKTNTEARLKAERRAGLSPKQRDRKKVKGRDVQVNVRATRAVKELLDTLAERLGGSVADHFELAVLAYAKANGVSEGEQ
jgi:hypothetical protein